MPKIKKSLAIIPVRVGSKRLKKKNLLTLDDKPLFAHSIECALNSKLFDKIHVSTESKRVVKTCKEYCLEPEFLRPKNLANDTSTIYEVCSYVIGEYENMGVHFDNLCIIWATSPLRTVSDLKKGFAMLKKNINAVVSVSEYDLPYYCGQLISEKNFIRPIFPKMMKTPSQSMPSVICDNGSFCFVKINAFKKFKTWMPPKTVGYKMPKNKAIDLETKDDFDFLKFLYNKNN